MYVCFCIVHFISGQELKIESHVGNQRSLSKSLIVSILIDQSRYANLSRDSSPLSGQYCSLGSYALKGW